MLETFQFQDPELTVLSVTKKDIIDSITIDDVKHFLESLGVTQIQVNYDKGYLICPTICHNPIQDAESMKLYWYQNNKIFRCYTECDKAMSIFNLYKKYMALNYYPVSDEEAKIYVTKCLQHLITSQPQEYKHTVLDLDKYKYTINIPTLDEYPEYVLSCFIHYYHPKWLQDGITKEAMDKFNILFSISHNSIVIPQKDINGRLIGVRERVFDEDAIEAHGKYHPITIGNINYHHLNSFTLYGIYEHKKSIQTRRSVIIAEGEKSVLLDDGYYGDLSNTVAVCGNKINKYQVSLLTNILGANEITIAFDKEYDTWNDTDAKLYRKKIEQMCKDYSMQASFSYIWDYDNLLKRKDSPFDRGKDIFNYLYKNRVKVK